MNKEWIKPVIAHAESMLDKERKHYEQLLKVKRKANDTKNIDMIYLVNPMIGKSEYMLDHLEQRLGEYRRYAKED